MLTTEQVNEWFQLVTLGAFVIAGAVAAFYLGSAIRELWRTHRLVHVLRAVSDPDAEEHRQLLTYIHRRESVAESGEHLHPRRVQRIPPETMMRIPEGARQVVDTWQGFQLIRVGDEERLRVVHPQVRDAGLATLEVAGNGRSVEARTLSIETTPYGEWLQASVVPLASRRAAFRSAVRGIGGLIAARLAEQEQQKQEEQRRRIDRERQHRKLFQDARPVQTRADAGDT